MRHPQPNRFGKFKYRIPEMRKVRDDKPRFASTQRMQDFERALTIVKRADRVDDQDHVERTAKRMNESLVLNITDQKSKVRVRLARLCNHCLAEIDPYAE